MQLATKIGAVAGVAGAGLAVGLHMAGRDGPIKAEAAAREEWDAWKAKLDAEFPTRMLPSEADDERFERFLAKNPAPKWIRVEHENLRQISIDPVEIRGERTKIRIATAAAVGVGLIAGLGGAALRYSNGASQAMQAAAAIPHVGGGALSLVSLGALFARPNPQGLINEIEATEWQTETSWTD